MYQAGVTSEDFPVYEEEIQWIEERFNSKKPVNPHVFRRKFDDFPWLPPTERLQDLLPDLKSERAFSDMTTLMQTVIEEMDVDNAVDKAQFLAEQVSLITRSHATHSDHHLVGDYETRLKQIKQLRAL